MTYAKKLLSAKILVSVGLLVYALLPLCFGQSGGAVYGHIIALPIMLWAVWSTRLFGTARSVRLMAYLGMAYVIGFFITGAQAGMETNALINAGVFGLLLAGIIFSIRRKTDG